MRIYLCFLCLFDLANAPESDKRDLKSELDLMKTLKPHPHVIKLLGCVTETGKCIYELFLFFYFFFNSFIGILLSYNSNKRKVTRT